MCVEPDGSVLPCQSYYQPLGNLLLDPWESIWNHELAVGLRERRNLPVAAWPAPCCWNAAAAARWHARQTRPSPANHLCHVVTANNSPEGGL
jgi:MoaA/NifB/PqqE/SkfB family radical SAM enzyme